MYRLIFAASFALALINPAAAQIIGSNPAQPETMEPTKPASRDTSSSSSRGSIVGDWTLVQPCPNKTITGQIRFDAAGPDGVSGVMHDSNGITSRIFGGGLENGRISFTITYEFFGTQSIDWRGTVESNRRIAIHSMNSWGAGCTAVISR